jgi:hypothetical protein
MKLVSILVIFFIIIYSCSSENKRNPSISKGSIDSFESAMPHGKSLDISELSGQDKQKLAHASGIIAEVIPCDSLKKLISNDSPGLTIYNFWDLSCKSCLTNNLILKRIQSENIDSLAFKVVYVNINGNSPDMVNSYIRENEIIDKTYIVKLDTIVNWPSYFQNGWEGQLPAMMIVNNDDGTRLFYQKEFTFEEFGALLFPLTF